jgi:hypothetical protein
MPNPVRPSSKMAWTQGNPGQQTQPTNGEKFGGYSPNQRPDPLKFNWLLGNTSDWVDWLDFATQGNMPVSNVGHFIATGTTVQAQLDELDAFIASLTFETVKLVMTGNPQVWTVPVTAINNNAPIIMIDGAVQIPTIDYTFAVVVGVGTVTFIPTLDPSEVPSAVVITALSPGSGGAGITGGFVVYGSIAGPVLITDIGGVTSTADQRALIFISTSGGAVTVTANPQISAGTKVGQELRLVGTSDTNYVILNDGNGLSLNGQILIKNKVSIDLWWDGAVWNENDRK